MFLMNYILIIAHTDPQPIDRVDSCLAELDKIISANFLQPKLHEERLNEFAFKSDVSIKSLLFADCEDLFLELIKEQLWGDSKVQDNCNIEYCKVRVCSIIGKYIPLKQYHLISTFISGFKKFVLENIDLKQTFILFNLKEVYNYGFDRFFRLGTIRGESTFYHYEDYSLVG